MRIVWELRDGRRTSRSLRSMCDDASPGVVQARLNDLIGAGFVSKCTGGGYELTDRGRSLLTSFLPLYAFAERWGVEYPGKDDALEAAG